MQSEQQQRIMGYFIEEAKDHLNTIEQGLLSLQSTMEDKAMREEVYRAAHSVKGGAGMLGVGSIHKTAHKLEDCFKYLEKALEESPVQVDPHLESLFLHVYDTLEALVEQLESPFGLTDETANDIMSDAEPVFQELNTHLVQLVTSAKTATVATIEDPKVAMKKAQPIQEKSTTQPISFKRDVLIGLREMLELFKQEDSPKNRQKLHENCTNLQNLGEQLELPGWSELLETSKKAIACEENPYRLLAGLVIKEIKEAQELVMLGRSVEIAPSEQLKALVAKSSISQEPERDHLTPSLTNETAESSASNLLNTSDIYIQTEENLSARQETGEWSIAYGEAFALEANQSSSLSYSQEQEETLNQPASIYSQSRIGSGAATNFAEPSEPEVGIAELNSLADIFEGQTPDLDETWQEEEIIMLEDMNLANTPEQFFSLDDQSDFSDLIGEEDNSEIPTAEHSTNDDWMGLLADETPEDVSLDSQDSTDAIFSEQKPKATSTTTASAESTFEDVLFEDNTQGSDFSDLLFDDDSADAFLVPVSDADDLNVLFGDSFLEEESSGEANINDFLFDDSMVENQEESAEMTSQLQQPEDDLFSISAEENLNNADASVLATDAILTDIPGDLDTLDLDNLENTDTTISDSEAPEFLLDGLSLDENASTNSEDSFLLELDDLGSNESLPQEAAVTESALDFNDLLEISGSETLAIKPSEQAPDVLGFDELLFDDSLTDFAGESSEDFDFSGLTSDNQLDTSLDEDLFALSTSNADSLTDFGQESLLFTDESNNSQTTELESATEQTLDSLDLDFELDATPSNTLELESTTEQTLDSLDLDFELEATPSNALELESATSSNLDSLDLDFELEATPSNALELESATSNILDSFDNQTLSAVESLDNQEEDSLEDEGLTLDYLDNFDEFFGSPTADTEPLENVGFETENLEESEENFAFDSSIDVESNQELEASENLLDLEGTDTLETENLEDFLSIASDDVTAVQSETVAIPEASEWDFELELEEEQTEAAEELDWIATDSESISQESPISLEAIALTSLGAGMLISSLTDNELTESNISQVPADAIISNSAIENEWEGLEDLLAEENQTRAIIEDEQIESEFADLEAMLAQEDAGAKAAGQIANTELDMFGELEFLLGDQAPEASQSLAPTQKAVPSNKSLDDEFGDMEKLLEEAEKTMGGPQKRQSAYQQPASSARNRPPIGNARKPDQTIRVPVKHLDNLSNLVGELVVNRNSLEQDQERLRQFLDNLSHQVMALSDVGARMQDLYERTLLESSLLASRYHYRSSFGSDNSSQNSNSSGPEYDPLEMDRFTGFHLLSQEMIELIVRVRESASDIEFLVDETDQVARMLRQVTTQLQEGLMRGRMVPFAQTTDRLPRAVREISLKLGKQAELQVDGRETLIDKLILEHLSDPLTHLVNNALTHGIEVPEVRQTAGKPRAGRITLRAFHQGNQTVISISDDGAGIDPEVVRKKAIEKKLISPAQAKTLTPLDLYEFLFHPGFSTKDKADDFSGRGVGMDVVLTSLSEIRGTIHIDSTLGKGTTFTIRLPLVLSICKALSCLSDKARIAFPMDGVEDTLDVSPAHVQRNSDGKTCIQWRDTLLPFQPLSELLKYNRHLSRGNVYGGKREDDTISIVVLRSAGNFLAIQVDQVLGQQEIVIKQLEGPAPKPVGIAGATVLGDGRIMPIADVLELIELSRGRIRPDGEVRIWSREEVGDLVPEEPPVTKVEPLVLIVDDSITVRSLLEMTFNKAGYRVEQARDGQEAWDKLRSGLPCDIVFCDIEMPRMDGLELLSRMQKDEDLCHLPIAMLTSRGSQRHQQMASELGARGYFIKPYLEEVLLDAAQRMIKGEVLLTSKSNA